MRNVDLPLNEDVKSETSLHLIYEYEAAEHVVSCADGEKISVRFNVISNFENVVDQTARQLKAQGVRNLESIHCPYFGILWPAARVLTDTLVRRARAASQPPRVLELGCGLALPSLALAQLGSPVIAIDHHPDVAVLLTKNWQQNEAPFPGPEFIQCDWQSLEEVARFDRQKLDWLIASDILYEKQMATTAAQALTRLAERCLVPTGEIWMTDPGRTHLQEFVHNMEKAGFQSQTEVVDEIFLLRFSFESGF